MRLPLSILLLFCTNVLLSQTGNKSKYDTSFYGIVKNDCDLYKHIGEETESSLHIGYLNRKLAVCGYKEEVHTLNKIGYWIVLLDEASGSDSDKFWMISSRNLDVSPEIAAIIKNANHNDPTEDSKLMKYSVNTMRFLRALEIQNEETEMLKEENEKMRKNAMKFDIRNFYYKITDPTVKIEMKIYNGESGKIIKYVYITLKAINPVNDIVGKPVEITWVGPIKSHYINYYKFDDLFYSHVIDKIVIKKYKVVYMDGTIKINENPRTPHSYGYDFQDVRKEVESQ